MFMIHNVNLNMYTFRSLPSHLCNALSHWSTLYTVSLYSTVE